MLKQALLTESAICPSEPSLERQAALLLHVSGFEKLSEARPVGIECYDRIARLARAALEGADPQALLEQAAALVADSLHADCTGVWELTPDAAKLRLRAGVGWSNGAVGNASVAADGRSAIGVALVSAKTVRLDRASDPASPSTFAERPLARGIGIPIHRAFGDSPYGVLCAYRFDDTPFALADESCLDAVASVLSSILEWRRAETERELLQTLTVGVSLADTLDSALAAAMASVLLVTRWECAESWIPTDEGKLRGGPVRALSREAGARLRQANAAVQFDRGQDLPGKVWAAGLPAWITDLSQEHDFGRKEMARSLNLRTAFCLPVVSHGRVLAVLLFYGSDRRREDKRLVDLIQAALAPVGPLLERKRLEEATRQLQAIVQSSDDAIIGTDADGTIISWNPAAERTYGIPAADAIAQPLAMLGVPDRGGQIPQVLARVQGGETVKNVETVQIAKSAQPVDISLSAAPIHDDSGNVIGASVIARDITERKQAEAALRESEERFRTMADSAPVMMWMADPDKSFTFVNKTWLQFRGRSLDAEQAHGWLEGLHPEDRAKWQSTFDAVFDGRNSLEVEFRMQRYDGEYRWILNTGVPRFVGDGVFAGYIGSCVDITERKEAEQFLELHARRQARLIREETRGRRRAEQRARDQLTQLAHLSRFSTMGEMATGLAHELNQPLCAIVNFTEACLELLSAHAPADDLRHLMSEVAGQAERAGEVIRHMRDFVRKREPRRSPVKINEVVHDVVSLIKPQAARDGVQIESEVTEPSPFVWADAVQIQQVLLNLVRNAMEAAAGVQDSRRLRIQVQSKDYSRIEIAVRDWGVGIPYENLDQVFTPFHSTKESGMGMGLSISRSIVEAHDGQIWVTRNPDRGVTFHFTLPVARSTEHGSAKPDSVRSG